MLQVGLAFWMMPIELQTVLAGCIVREGDKRE